MRRRGGAARQSSGSIGRAESRQAPLPVAPGRPDGALLSVGAGASGPRSRAPRLRLDRDPARRPPRAFGGPRLARNGRLARPAVPPTLRLPTPGQVRVRTVAAAGGSGASAPRPPHVSAWRFLAQQEPQEAPRNKRAEGAAGSGPASRLRLSRESSSEQAGRLCYSDLHSPLPSQKARLPSHLSRLGKPPPSRQEGDPQSGRPRQGSCPRRFCPQVGQPAGQFMAASLRALPRLRYTLRQSPPSGRRRPAQPSLPLAQNAEKEA